MVGHQYKLKGGRWSLNKELRMNRPVELEEASQQISGKKTMHTKILKKKSKFKGEEMIRASPFPTK